MASNLKMETHTIHDSATKISLSLECLCNPTVTEQLFVFGPH